ncbi:MAG: hypothetical protein QOJ29_2697 [Thermoleophilaceae bacterium]|jgi:hypothetical protein|nr:hypothetical protein [Frankiaceae bacterium]MEA2494786.1 hypothetical protein [Thermoleophilaceae bacterium]
MVHVGSWHLIGLVKGSDRCHVIASPHMDAMTALCGAGLINGHVSWWYDPADPLACPGCSERIRRPDAHRPRDTVPAMVQQ